MDARQGPAMPSLVRALLLGSGLAAAAFTASLLWGAAPAHASEGSAPAADPAPDAGLLGAVTRTLDATTGGVADVLDSAPVTQLTAPVLTTVDSTLHAAVATVPVAGPILAPVTDSVATTPIVAPVTGLLDEALGVTAEVVGGAGVAVGDLVPTPGSAVPCPSGVTAPLPTADAAAADSPADLAASADPASTFDGRFFTLVPAADHALAPSASGAGGLSPVTPSVPSPSPRGTDTGLPANTGGSASGGASAAGAAGDASHVPSAPRLTTGPSILPSDDSVPSSPVFDTDSSPD